MTRFNIGIGRGGAEEAGGPSIFDSSLSYTMNDSPLESIVLNIELL